MLQLDLGFGVESEKNVVDMSSVYVFEIRSKADFAVGNIYTWIFENAGKQKISTHSTAWNEHTLMNSTILGNLIQ